MFYQQFLINCTVVVKTWSKAHLFIAMKNGPYSYLFIDVFDDVISNRLRINVLPIQFPLIIYGPKF